jgi:hypothetical protein
MKLAIHHRAESFSEKWVEYCNNNGIAYELVDCYSSSAVEEIKKCNGLMWHWPHHDHKAQLFARQLIYSLEEIGIKVFPNSKTCWHYDDKVGQKYLLEAIDAPLVPSYVFYDKNQALDWAASTTYPKVFKLRSGAGSKNVKLVSDFRSASRLIRRAFGKGFKATERWSFLAERLWHFKRDRNVQSFINISRGIGRLLIPSNAEIHLPVEKNYVYFQDFIPNNTCDVRITVIGRRAFGFVRLVRDNDFRASGSGKILYDRERVPHKCINISFQIARKLSAQSIAIDFVVNNKASGNDQPLIVEISYAYNARAVYGCGGYWDEYSEWHDIAIWPQDAIIEEFLDYCNK